MGTCKPVMVAIDLRPTKLVLSMQTAHKPVSRSPTAQKLGLLIGRNCALHVRLVKSRSHMPSYAAARHALQSQPLNLLAITEWACKACNELAARLSNRTPQYLSLMCLLCTCQQQTADSILTFSERPDCRSPREADKPKQSYTHLLAPLPYIIHLATCDWCRNTP